MSVEVKEEAVREMTPHDKQEITGAESTHSGLVFTPAVDICESDSAITVLADMPGVRAEGLSIDLRENVLTIEGRIDDGEPTPNARLLLQEYRTGSFRREFRLTNLIDQDRIDASLRDGVLRLTLPKAEAARPRKIEVRTA